MKRLALALAAVMLLGCVGCGRALYGTELGESTAGTATVSESTTTESTTVDLGGYEFSILTRISGFPWYSQPLSEDQQRYMDIWHSLEEEYGFKVSITEYEQLEALDAYALSGVKAADAMYEATDLFDAPLLGKYLKRLNTDEVKATGLDISDEKLFEQNFVNAVRIDGEAYFFNFCGNYFEAQVGYFAALNKELCKDAGYSTEMIYQAVRDRVWTWDVLLDACRAGKVFNEASGEYSVYGMTSLRSNFMMAAYGCAPIKYSDGKYVSTIGSVLAKATIRKMLEMRLEGMVASAPSPASSSRVRFYNGQVLFGLLDQLGYLVHGCPFEYGIVPLPMGNTLSGYRSPTWGGIAFCIQETNRDWEKTCFIMGKAAEAFGDVDAGIENLYGYVQDEASKEMLREYIIPGLYLSISDMASDKTVPALSLYFRAALGGDEAGAAECAEAFDAAVDEAFRLFNK